MAVKGPVASSFQIAARNRMLFTSKLLFRDTTSTFDIRSANAGSVSKAEGIAWTGLSHCGVKAVLKPESFPIDKIYVPVKRRKALKSEVVQESRRAFWKSDNKLQFSFDLTMIASFWSRGFIGWKRAKHLARKQSSDAWSRLMFRIQRRSYLKILKQKQNARRWND